MILLKLNAKGDAVTMLQELLNEFDYNLVVNGNFNAATEAAVRDFQTKNQLVSDGVVYTKTWIRLLNNSPADMADMQGRFLKEQDIIRTAGRLGIETAVLKAVNEVESNGRGFNIDGSVKILFEGHVFWQQLKDRSINPGNFVSGNESVLYPKWVKKHYLGGKGEYTRLNKATGIWISSSSAIQVAGTEAAYAAASWGLFQIMGYHFKSLGYKEVIEFVGEMKESEGNQLDIFAKYIEVNNLLKYLKNKQWADFALRYNGAGYKANKYDEKLAKAYQKYS